MKRFVVYRGVRMIEGWPERIRQAQALTHLTIDGVRVRRVPFGSESDDWGAADHACHDCRVIAGEYHVPLCDGEECPSCHTQLITCECDIEEPDGVW